MAYYEDLPNVLVGMNFFNVHHKTSINKKENLDFSPDWLEKPYVLSTGTGIAYDPKRFPKVQTNVNIQSNNEVPTELGLQYSAKSMMSLDGIFSPISFYPTPYSATFNITKYPTSNCPFCFGTKTYSYRVDKDTMQINMDGARKIDDSEELLNRPCTFCESVDSKLGRIYTSASSRETMPPHILASGDDLTIISKMPTTGSSGNPIINYSTLNPIVLSTGEFSNFQNKQSGDLTGHCIDLVAFGFTVPHKGDGLRPSFSTNIERSYSDYDMNLIDWREKMTKLKITIPEIPKISNNMRFFGLRGPVMLHAWGYDTEGYPVPNASGEPLIEDGAIVRDKDKNIVGKNQKRIGESTSDGETWSKPYKENTFYKGWAQQPGTWPVGPIDFRWDENAGVWTIGANYKAVHIVIEEDLVGTVPARGAIMDATYDNNPLPSGLRRLAFVKDPFGIYSAPRGAPLYCKYNSNNGFYEPIGFRPFITSGIISSTNTVNIYKVYTKPNDPNLKLSDDPKLEVYETQYKNPLKYNVSIGDVGMFTYIDRSWVLYAYNFEG